MVKQKEECKNQQQSKGYYKFWHYKDTTATLLLPNYYDTLFPIYINMTNADN